jgi:hypothetical protein
MKNCYIYELLSICLSLMLVRVVNQIMTTMACSSKSEIVCNMQLKLGKYISIVFTIFHLAIIANCFVIIYKLLDAACTCIIMYSKLESNYNRTLYYQYV